MTISDQALCVLKEHVTEVSQQLAKVVAEAGDDPGKKTATSTSNERTDLLTVAKPTECAK